MRTWVEKVIADKKRVAMPVMTHPGIELIGKSVLQAITDGEVHHQAIMALNEKYPSAASTVIMDLTVEAEAFGAKIIFNDDEIATVNGSMLKDELDIETLEVPDLNEGRVQEYLKANRLTAEKITDKPVFAGCIGPFSLAGRLYDMSEMLMLPYLNPDAAIQLLDKCTEFIYTYCQALKDTGVSGVIMAEPAAGLLDDDTCQAFSSDFIKRIVNAVQDDYFAVILHDCGNKGNCTKATVSVGAMGYHFGNAIDLPTAAKEVPADALVMGNLDPSGLFRMGTPETMKSATLTLLDKMKAFPNFILSSGCDTPPHSPFANIDAFYEALDEYNANL